VGQAFWARTDVRAGRNHRRQMTHLFRKLLVFGIPGISGTAVIHEIVERSAELCHC